MFIVIAAGFASGKNMLVTIRKYGEKLAKYLKEVSKANMNEYEEKMTQWKADKKEGIHSEKPEPPYLPRLFLPADSSAAALKNDLIAAGETGIIFESESDTLTDILSKEWGGVAFSSILRRAFEHEPIEFSRAKFGGDIELPKLALVVTGTPSTVRNMAPSVENGLFSRMSYYSYSINPKFDKKTFDYKDMSKSNEVFEKYSEDILKMYQFFEKQTEMGKTYIFHWKEDAQKRLIPQFESWLDTQKAIVGNDGAKILFRMGLVASRIGAILSTLRLFEGDQSMDGAFSDFEQGQEKWFTATDDDLETTIHLVDIIRQHTFSVFENLKPEKEDVQIKTKNSVMTKFFDHLPESFSRAEALEIGDKIDVKGRTVGKYLTHLVKVSLLERDNKGGYKKVSADN